MLSCILFAMQSTAQFQALDFSMTDTKGDEYRLFDLLDSGKTVILDFFFVDCTPCRTFTPTIEAYYQDYGGANGEVMVLGISDRDMNDYIEQFEEETGATYPSAGIEGGGDEITLQYMSAFPFVGWPTYAIVCPNGYMSWEMSKFNDLEEFPDTIAACSIRPNSVSEFGFSERSLLVYPNPSSGEIRISSKFKNVEMELLDITGQVVREWYSEGEVKFQLDKGLYFVRTKSKTVKSRPILIY